MKQPKLRFKADDGSSFPDLKEKRLNDVCEYNKGQSVGVNYVGTENMKQDFSGVNDLDSRNEVKGVAYNIGDTLMSNIRPYLKKTWKADVNGVCSTDVLVFHPTDINSDYLYRNISSEKFISYVMTAAKGTKMPRGDKEHIMNYDIQVPCLLEQQKIASLFYELDNLIQSAEKELEGYRELKQGMLQKMFPKNGEATPEIRFPEFTDDWKQCQISEMFKITRGYVLPVTETSKETSIEMPYPVYSSQTKDNGLMGYYGNYLYEDAITWTTDGANAGTVNYRAGKFYCTNVCGVLLSDKMETSKAIAEALNIVAKKYVSYVGNPKLMNNVMAEIQIAVPPTKEERDKISSYFESLDNLIALQQEELDGYKELKKGLLQQMFC